MHAAMYLCKSVRFSALTLNEESCKICFCARSAAREVAPTRFLDTASLCRFLSFKYANCDQLNPPCTHGEFQRQRSLHLSQAISHGTHNHINFSLSNPLFVDPFLPLARHSIDARYSCYKRENDVIASLRQD